jgi:hypothetical protein
MADRPKLAISQQRIGGKLHECEFFLEHMEDCGSPEEFGYYLSAFLAALATFTDLALRRKHGRHSNRVLRQLRKTAADLDFLLNARDVEVHRDGVRIWLYRPSQIWGRFLGFGQGLWPSLALTRRQPTYRYHSRFGDGVRLALERTRRNVPGQPGCSMIFEGSGRDVQTCCRNALESVRLLSE